MSDIKKGDRVKVTVEAEVVGTYDDTDKNDGGLDVLILGDAVLLNHSAILHGEDGLTVEKVKPPVETFGPGDVVRGKQQAPDYVALAKTGYVELSEGGRFYPYCKGSIGITPAHFTSERYERVTIS